MRGKQNPFTSSEFVLLGFLYEKPTHGYELHKQIADPDGIGLIWHINMSNLYAQLEKLAQKDYITGVLHPGDTHPNRTEYHITPDGKNAFEDWVKTTVMHPRDFRQEFMARYFFSMKFFPSTTQMLCQKQLMECETWLKNTVNSSHGMNKPPIFKGAVVSFRFSQINAIITWLEEIQDQPA
jgi:PadR family transcriptional regulator, regulatory protein AphA